jgi:molybdopterin synthase catalytic subunit
MNTWVNLTNDSLDPKAISDFCTTPTCGAVVVFLGTTRNNFEGRTVTTLSYEAFTTMAISELEAICNEAIEKFPGTIKASIHHRLGEVPVGETSIVCCISSEHRKEAFYACEWMMHDLKARVPIWKKEHFTEGEAIWKENIEFTA